MIRSVLVQITRNRNGQPIRTERQISGDILRIGRGAECAIHLPDYSVKLRHALIRCGDAGIYYIEGEGTPISVNGAFHQVAEFAPGTRVSIGPYELIAEMPTADGELVVSVELVRPHPRDETLLARAPTSLAAAGLSKRRPAIWLAFLIAVVFLLLPLLQANSPAVRQALASLPITPEQTWSPGPLLPGHQAFASECGKCHQGAFATVADQACQGCHDTTSLHAVQSGATNPSCTECHRDHQGRHAPVRSDRSLCVSCHGDIKASSSTASQENVHGFDTDHPPFQLTFKIRPGEPQPRRISQSDKKALVEDSGLRFSHKVHAGKLRLPSDPQIVYNLDCNDCHQPDSGGVRFKPVTMQEHCLKCHFEEFDFNPPIEGHRLPHASVRAVLDVLEHFHLDQALKLEPSRNGTGARGKAAVQQAVDAAALRARQTAKSLAGDMGCGYCHEIDPTGDGAAVPWQIRPLAVTECWLPKARFTHERHRANKCAECHDMSRSKKSSDVVIPDLKKCRQCHAGEQAKDNKVASPCSSCHRFHDQSAVQCIPRR
jgi:FHA domain